MFVSNQDGLGALLLQGRRRDGTCLFGEQHPHFLVLELPRPRTALARLVQLVLFLEKSGLVVTPFSHLFAAPSSSSCAVVVLGLESAPPACSQLLPKGSVARAVEAPLVLPKKRFRFAAVIQEPANAQEDAAAAAAAGQPDEPIDFAARVEGMSSDKIFAAVRWDPAWKSGLTEIVWEDRFMGFVRKPVAQFSPSAIPWHRVRAFFHQGKLIWYRGDMADLEAMMKTK